MGSGSIKQIGSSFLFTLLYHYSISQTGTISGRILNAKTKEGLPGASVSVSKTNHKMAADSNGDYRLTGLPPGDYEILFEYVGYFQNSRHIKLKPGETAILNIKLGSRTESLDEVYVFGRINGENEASSRTSEKKANNIVNIISAKAMERSPDINAADVLQRMSGITLDKNSGADESYAIVRGLDPRYNNTLVNGVKIASPEEKSRYVSLNVVPSDLLQKIEISKSLLPEMEGDAIGGTVNLVMKDAPDSPLFKVVGSLGYSKILIDRPYETFSKADIQPKSLNERFGSSYVAQPGDFSRTNLEFNSATTLPTSTAGITWGQRFMREKLGVLVADNFQNQYYGTNSQFNAVVPDTYLNKPDISDVTNRTFSTQQLNNGLTLHADYNFNERNKIIINNVYLYSYLAQARQSIDTAIKGGNGGRTVPGTGPVTDDYESITEHQQIENLKVEGRHILTHHLLFDWAAVYSVATKRTPDRADLNINTKIDTVHTNGDINGPYTFTQTPYYFDQITRIWQHNEDKDYDLLGNLTYKSIWKKFFVELKAGGLYRHKTRFNLQDEYDLKPTTNSGNGIKQVFTNIQTAQWIVYDPAGTYDYDVNNYKAYENITAGYGQMKLSVKKLDIFGGIRVEQTQQGFTINTFYPTQINGVKKDYTDLLPSVMAKFKLNDKTNLRLSYFKSISRPNYYELVPADVLSSSSATTSRGNPYLLHSVADNYDIRYEFFPKEEEQLFIGGFYKKIQNPIEYAYIDGTIYQPQNFGTATIYGAELVYTKYFGKLGVTGNYTYIYSEIYSTKSFIDATHDTAYDRLQKRPMQGQTNNTLNLSLLYRDDKQNVFVQLSYEYLGKTLALVYPVYGYDYYQIPQSFLSLSAEKQLRNKHFTAFGKFNNLLNTATVNKINDLLTVRDVYKYSFSLGLRYTK